MSEEQKEEENETAAQRMRSTRQAGVEEQNNLFASETFDMTPEELDAKLNGPNGDKFFDNANSSILKTVLLLYMKSGYFDFDQWRSYSSSCNGQPVNLEKLKEQIEDEQLSEEELRNIVKSFLTKHSYTDSCIMSCGACGIRQMEKESGPSLKYTRVSLEDERMNILQYSEKEVAVLKRKLEDPRSQIRIPVDENWQLQTINVWKAKSFYIQNSSPNLIYWHLHPELIEHDSISNGCEWTVLCPDCSKSVLKRQEIPKLSIANGIDFGVYYRLPLTQPGLHEQLCISRTRLYVAVLKASLNTYGSRCNFDVTNTIRCHAVLFPHNAPQVLDNLIYTDIFGENGLFNINELKKLMMIFLVDEHGKRDHLAKEVFGTAKIAARSYVAAQWILVSQKLNPYYHDIDVSNISRATMNKVFDVELSQALRKSAQVVNDPDAVLFDRHLGADIAENQHKEQYEEPPQVHAAGTQEPISGQVHTEVEMRCSLVVNTEAAYLSQDQNDFRLNALRTIAEDPDLASRPSGSTAEATNTTPGFGDGNNDKEKTTRCPLRDGFDWDAIQRVINKNKPNNCAREETLISDFTNDDTSFGTAFPHVFMFGKAYYRAPGRLSHQQRHHLLHQFTLIPGQDRRLLGFLFDVMQRCKVMDGVKSYVEGNSHAVNTMRKLVNNEKERAELKEALDKPKSDKSTQVLHKYLKVLRFSGKNVQYGAVEGSNLKHRAIGLVKRYSAPTCFLTISPTNLDNPRSLRLSFRTMDNKSFPAVFEPGCPYGEDGTSFIHHLAQHSVERSSGVVHVPEPAITKSKRTRLGMSNPIAFVQENKNLLSDIVSILIGLPIEGSGFYSSSAAASVRKTIYNKKINKGILGHALTIIGCTEDHAKGHLHFHLTITAGLPAIIMQRFAHLNDICKSISKVLDSMYRSEINSRNMAASTIKRFLLSKYSKWDLEKKTCDSLEVTEPLLLRPRPMSVLEEELGAEERIPILDRIVTSVEGQAASQQHHKDGRHNNTCRKGTWGITGCRLNYPAGLSDTTKPTKLVPRVPMIYWKRKDLGTVFGKANSEDVTDDMSVSSEDQWEAVEVPVPKDKPIYVPVQLDTEEIDPMDEPVVHSMVPILEKPGKEMSVVVWETKRPQNNCVLPSPPPENEFSSRKMEYINAMKDFLKEAPPLNDSHSEFWRWLEHTACYEQVKAMHDHLEVRIAGLNGYVASFNPILSFCAASHNNVSLLGSLGQAKSALFYLIPYQGKNKFQFQDSLSILNSSLNHVDAHPSVADDTGTTKRTVKHVLTRTLNRMHLCMEISDYQIAAALLELPSFICSDIFAYGNPSAVAAFETKLLMHEDRRYALETTLRDLTRKSEEHGSGGSRYYCRNYEELVDTDDEEEEEEESDQDGDEGSGPATTSTVYQDEDVVEQLGHIIHVKLRGGGGTEDMSDDEDGVSPPEEVVLFPSAGLYHLKGSDLDDINLYEYIACVKFENKSMPDNITTSKRSRRCLSHFEFSHDFIGVADCRQSLRQKIATPLLTGRIPPHPGDQPVPSNSKTLKSWKKKANEYARYYLTLFRPTKDGERYTYDWQTLVSWIEDMQNDTKIISKFRLMCMDNHMKGLASSSVARKMTLDFRSRCRDKWTEDDRCQFARERKMQKQQEKLDKKRLMEVENEVTGRLRKSDVAKITKQLKHDEAVDNLLHDADGAGNGTSSVPSVNNDNTNTPSNIYSNLKHGVVHPLEVHQLQHIVELMNECKKSTTGMDDDYVNGEKPMTEKEFFDGDANYIAKIREELDRDGNGTNSQQLEIYDLYSNYFAAGEDGRNSAGDPVPKPPQVVLLHGGPGVGKTTVRDAIIKAAKRKGRFCLKTAFNGINATEMGGETTSYLLGLDAAVHMNLMGRFSPDKIHDLRKLGFSKYSIVIVEEVSTQAPWHLARLHRMCQEANNNDEPFGGCLVILIGDFTQLGPVKAGHTFMQAVADIYASKDCLRKMKRNIPSKDHKKKTLFSTQNREDDKYKADSPFRIGTDLLLSARWFEMNQQQRAAEDLVHTRVVRRTYLCEKISRDDVKDGYKCLSAEDMKDGAWLKAPVLVSTNRERFTLTHTRAKQYAKHFGKVVIRWMSQYKDWEGMPQGDNAVDALDDPCFYEYFVQGADGFLTQRVNKALNLVNSLPVKYHSIKFDDDNQKILDAYLQSAKPGDVITMDCTPVCVNVQLSMPENTPKESIRRLRSFSLVRETCGEGGEIPIVIPLYHKSGTKWDNSKTPVRGSHMFLPSRVRLKRHFPVDPAFAMTVHKAEGQTLLKVIISISDKGDKNLNFSYAQLHVALSRVRKAEDIRLLIANHDCCTLDYINHLKPDPCLAYFFSGFKHYDTVKYLENPNLNWSKIKWDHMRADILFRTKPIK